MCRKAVLNQGNEVEYNAQRQRSPADAKQPLTALHHGQDGMQQSLHLAAAGTLDIGAIEHVRLPDLIGVFGFELLVRRGSEQLAFSEAALFEETI